MASLNTLFQKASVLLRFGSQGELEVPASPSPRRTTGHHHGNSGRPSSLSEGEVVFCKNNVCVHPPVPVRVESMDHHPGYLSIRTREDELLGATLILTWIPNSTLKKNPRSLENRLTPSSSPCRSNRSSNCPSPTYHSGVVGSGAGYTLSVSGYGSGYASTADPSMAVGQSGNTSPLGGSEKSYADLGSVGFLGHTGCCDPDRRSISSTMSDLGSPRDDIQSLDSWTTVGGDIPETSTPGSAGSHEISNDFLSSSESLCPKASTSSTASAHTIKEIANVTATSKSQSDSGIGPEEVTAALESMITGLNNIDGQTNPGGEKKCCDPKLSSHILKKPEAPREKELRKSIESLQKAESTGDSSSTTPTTSNKDPQSYPESPADTPPPPNGALGPLKLLYVEGTPESLAHAHNLTFPDAQYRRGSIAGGISLGSGWSYASMSGADGTHSPGRMSSSASSICASSHRESSCGLFSVDLSQMRSLRLFFCDKEQTCGQLVVASRESQYKILHFHNGGLDRLAQVFEEWNHLLTGTSTGKNGRRWTKSRDSETCCPYRQFSVCRPQFSEAECHPEEGLHGIVNEQTWRDFMAEDGQIEDDYHLRKAIFFGGLESELRNEVWPFLLHHYGFKTTFDQREQIRNDSYIEYQGIRRRREQMTPEERDQFWKTVQCTVEKDVVRTDRCNPFFAGDDNPNIKLMETILLSYAVFNPTIGYTQGMSDLLAPVLAEIKDEAESFWCFVGLMHQTIFFSSPRDTDMDVNLNYLLELLRLMTPTFYSYLNQIRDGLELLFAHRWILLCFKREFPEREALRLWESCWAHYQTDYFHLFICLAIVAVYGDDVVQQGLRSDEMLLHFSSLAMHMDGEVVLRKARGLLHQFRRLPVIPCTLSDLCQLCGPGMWDSGHVPLVECRSNHGDVRSCPNGGQEIPPGAIDKALE